MHGPYNPKTGRVVEITPAPLALPHNIEAEQALLGAILLNNDALDQLGDKFSADHFHEPLHGRIFAAIQSEVLGGMRVTPVTLAPLFSADPPVGAVTIPQYLGKLAASATSVINAKFYAASVYETWTRRQLVEIGEEMTHAAYESVLDYPTSAQIEDAEAKLFSIAEGEKYGAGFQEFDTALAEAMEKANIANASNGGLSGLSTGLSELDKLTGGLHESDLIIIAGRPSMGKTALATNIAFNVAKKLRGNAEEAVVGFFSLEMSAEQLATRIISEQAEVSSEKIRRGLVDRNKFNDVLAAEHALRGLPLHIDDTGGISIAQLAARARRLKRQSGLSLLIIDYLQLMTSNAKTNYSNRVQEVTAITIGLKAMAKELCVPVIALSQLSRQIENRESKRPMLSDLRESGSIEQDADVVMFVYRDEYYVERRQPDQSNAVEHHAWQSEMAAACGKAEVIVAKQRHGPTGTATQRFTGEFTRFSDLT
jgi:replicative DNA helicase